MPDVHAERTYETVPNLDAGLSAVQAAKATAWRTYVDGQLGDLVVRYCDLTVPRSLAQWIANLAGQFFLLLSAKLL